MPFSFKLLRVFVAVAHRQSFTRAAEQMGLTQPGVSKSIHELERQAGTRLVERIPTGVRLTEAGTVLLGHARTILAEERAAEDALHALRGLGQGSLRIGASPTIATYMLPAFVQRFNAQHPAIEMHLRTLPSRDVAAALLARELDIGLAEAPVPEDARMTIVPWCDDELVIVAAPSHPLAPQAPIPVAAVASELLVLREQGSGTRTTVLSMLAAHGVVPQRTLDADSVESIKRIVAAGLGLSIISRAAIEDMLSLRRLVVLETTDCRMTRPLNRLALRTSQSSATKAFVAMLHPGPGISVRSTTSRTSDAAKTRPARTSRARSKR
jgi:DNA-binding transcriptional LysR family regulator